MGEMFVFPGQLRNWVLLRSRGDRLREQSRLYFMIFFKFYCAIQIAGSKKNASSTQGTPSCDRGSDLSPATV